MALHEIAKLDKKGLRKFGYTTGAVLACLFGLLLPWIFSRPIPRWPWIAAAVLATWATIAPLSLQPLYQAWMRFGAVLGWINTRIILGVVFYALIMPVGFIVRTFTHDPMARKLDADATTYRLPSKQSPPDNMKRPF
jgi:hypothetical protein